VDHTTPNSSSNFIVKPKRNKASFAERKAEEGTSESKQTHAGEFRHLSNIKLNTIFNIIPRIVTAL